MMYQFLKKDPMMQKPLVFCDPDEATFIAIPCEEFNGYQKAVDIVDHRGRQQVEKSVVDEHGFRLLRAEKRNHRFDSHNEFKSWHIIKRTPLSIKVRPEDAAGTIESMLIKYYRYITDADWDDYAVALNMVKGGYDEGRSPRVQEYMDLLRTGYWASYSMDALTINAQEGVYEVAYWADKPI